MIFISVLIYVHPGKLCTLHRYERLAVRIMADHGGKIVKVIRPTSIVGKLPIPDEIHSLEFESQKGFDNFRKDSRLQELVQLKSESVRDVVMILGESGEDFYQT